jgi:hypothetical protein
VAFQPTGRDGAYAVLFCHQEILSFDLRECLKV